MATCPNKNLDSWKNLVKSRGEDIAYYLWDKYDGNVPKNEYVKQENIKTPSEEKARILKYVNAVNGFINPVSKGIADEEVINYNEKYGADVLYFNKTVNNFYTIAINKKAKPYPKKTPVIKPSYTITQDEIDKLYEKEYELDIIEDDPEKPSDLEVDYEYFIEKLLTRNGKEPDMFMSKGRIYVMNPRGYYNIIDQYTNKVIFTDIDIKTKQAIFAFDQETPREILKQEKIKLIEEIAKEVNDNYLDIRLALKDIDVSKLTEDAYKAQSLDELDRIRYKLLENIC